MRDESCWRRPSARRGGLYLSVCVPNVKVVGLVVVVVSVVVWGLKTKPLPKLKVAGCWLSVTVGVKTKPEVKPVVSSVVNPVVEPNANSVVGFGLGLWASYSSLILSPKTLSMTPDIFSRLVRNSTFLGKSL